MPTRVRYSQTIPDPPLVPTEVEKEKVKKPRLNLTTPEEIENFLRAMDRGIAGAERNNGGGS